MNEDIKFMKEAIKLAKKRKGLTHPNPTVGAVIVKDGKIIGKGYHKKAGLPHAEREAIKDALKKGHDLKGSTMYITLEPCCHYGKTPPCTDAIIENKISQVVVATLDSNPLVAGKGIEKLKKHGINVKVGILEEEAKNLNRDFFTYITEGRPYIILKWAQSIDGKIATFTGDSKWITNEKARKDVHKLRKEVSAILVGKNTALEDNPELTVRHIKTEKQPIRVLIDKDLEVPPDYKIYNEKTKTIVFTSLNPKNKKTLQALQKRPNVEVVKKETVEGKIPLREILGDLYKKGVVSLLVEGGSKTISQFLKEKLFDEINVYIGNVIIGDGKPSVEGTLCEEIRKCSRLQLEKVKKIGDDVKLTYKIRK